MTTPITLSYRTWTTLTHTLFQANKNSTEGVGAVWLLDDRGELVAGVASDDFHLAVRLHTPAPFEGFAEPVTLRTLIFIESLGEDDNDVTVSFDHTATVTLAGVTMSVDRPHGPTPAAFTVQASVPTAQINVLDLTRGVAAADMIPYGASATESADTPMWFSVISSDEVVLSKNWAELGRSTVRTPARVLVDLSEAVHVATHAAQAITPLILAVSDPGDTVNLHLQADDGHSLSFTTNEWSLRVRTAKPAATTSIEQLTAHLKHRGAEITPINDNSIVIGVHPNLVRIDAYGHTTSILRCSRVLATGICPSSQLYEEINSINQGLIDINIWHHDNKLVLGADLDTHTPDEVTALITTLNHRAEQLGPALTSFALTTECV